MTGAMNEQSDESTRDPMPESSGNVPVDALPRSEHFSLAEILQAAPDIVAMIDVERKIKYINRAAGDVLGVFADTLVGTLWDEVLHPEDRARLSQLWPLLLNSDELGEARYRVRNREGNWVWLDTRMRRMRGPTGQSSDHVILAGREATVQIHLEQAFQRAKEEAEGANRAKSEFLSRMSHELRTPLNAILGFAQLLGMDELDPDQHESVKEIRRSGGHLLQLIDEVLDISRIEAGKARLEVEPVCLLPIVEESTTMVAPLASERGVRLHVLPPHEGLHVLADEQRLKQVLLNLLSNAIKYNRPEGDVKVVVEETEGHVRISVTDTGLGIAPEFRDRLFSPFDRLGAERHDTQGTGLGLALSKKLMEAMEGTIDVETSPGRGSTFSVELPIADALRADGSESREVSGSAGCLLYIEDSPANLRLVERLIAKHRPGITLMTAMRGESGVELARLHQPRLVLLDVNLPDINGDQVLERLKAEPSTREIPVVMVSADASTQKVASRLASGAHGYFTKPLDVDQMLTAIDELMGTQPGKRPS